MSSYCSFKKPQNQIFGTKSSSGWVLTCVRTFKFSSSTTFNFIIWSENGFLTSKNHKIKFLGRGLFGMSSYMCENFQLFVLYSFQFHHTFFFLFLCPVFFRSYEKVDLFVTVWRTLKSFWSDSVIQKSEIGDCSFEMDLARILLSVPQRCAITIHAPWRGDQ